MEKKVSERPKKLIYNEIRSASSKSIILALIFKIPFIDLKINNRKRFLHMGNYITSCVKYFIFNIFASEKEYNISLNIFILQQNFKII